MARNIDYDMKLGLEICHFGLGPQGLGPRGIAGPIWHLHLPVSATAYSLFTPPLTQQFTSHFCIGTLLTGCRGSF